MTDAETTPSDAAPRERVDRREWAVRHLSLALAAESVDEKDYHVSMARQLLTATEGSGAPRPSGRSDASPETDEPS